MEVDKILNFLKKSSLIVRDIMTPQPLVVSPDETVQDAAKKMMKARIGNVLIVENSKVVGIVTERDIMNKVVVENKNSHNIKVKEVMTKDVVSVLPDEELAVVYDMMFKHNLRRMPVLDKGKLVGIITTKDILRAEPQFLKNKIEWMKIKSVRDKPALKSEGVMGMCESCGEFSENLQNENGQWVCQECC